MPVIKPVFTAVASAPVATGGVITTTVSPVVSRYFALITVDMIGETVITIPATSFIDDADVAVTDLPALTTEQYYNVYINGVLQQSSMFTLTTTELVIAAIDISVGVPVSLEVASFAGTTSTLTDPPTISAPIITITS